MSVKAGHCVAVVSGAHEGRYGFVEKVSGGHATVNMGGHGKARVALQDVRRVKRHFPTVAKQIAEEAVQRRGLGSDTMATGRGIGGTTGADAMPPFPVPTVEDIKAAERAKLRDQLAIHAPPMPEEFLQKYCPNGRFVGAATPADDRACIIGCICAWPWYYANEVLKRRNPEG